MLLSLQNLKQLNRDAVELNEKLKEIISELDEQSANLAGMRDISLRIHKAFELYRRLVNEAKGHN